MNQSIGSPDNCDEIRMDRITDEETDSNFPPNTSVGYKITPAIKKR